jgi:hypothetical protein
MLYSGTYRAHFLPTFVHEDNIKTLLNIMLGQATLKMEYLSDIGGFVILFCIVCALYGFAW